MYGWALKKILGTKNERELKRMQPRVDAINLLEPEYQALSDEALRGKTAEFRAMIERGASTDELLIPAFATAREAGKRALGMRHFDVQLLGGMVLHEGKIAEMKTGEGKTLVATLACYLNALAGKGVHVVTVNDYLATRDAEWMGQLYRFLGMSTGVVVHSQGDSSKKKAYAADITYGQNNEFGFDYMRDNMKFSIHDYVQRDLHYAIVDEVDSILIDEARTPLIISGPGQTASEKYIRINDILPRLRKDDHYTVDEKASNVTLTEEGIILAQTMLKERGITEEENLYDPVNLETLHILQQLLRAHTLYKRDQQYMVTAEGKVMIIDEFTGRTLPGRRWSDGLHQAIEAKERVPIQDENITLATISFQNLFRLYGKLAGMTGTADTEAAEFHKIYNLDVVVVPTNKPIQRIDSDDLVYKTEREKFKAVAAEIEDAQQRGQPVLVGTTSVEKSDALARLLNKRGVEHNVLNAKQHEREAYIVAQAGRKGAVTVATNMAGRGTDIVLGGNPDMLARHEVLERADEALLADKEALEAAVDAETERYREQCEQEKKEVLDNGGLMIIGTERHESRRVDNQLRGRSGRQGDPGSSRFFLSLEDDLMRIFAGDRVQRMMDTLGMEEDVPIEHRWVTKAVENAQKKVEERNFDIRKNLLEYDDVMNQQRKSVYVLRKQVLCGQYRTVPTEEEQKRGVEPVPLISTIDPKYAELAKPVLEQMIKFHGGPQPSPGASQEELERFRKQAQQAELSSLGTLRTALIERDVYVWFGCRVDLSPYREEPEKALQILEQEVGSSLAEQQERLLALVDELVGVMVERACPPNKHFEDWDIQGLTEAFSGTFDVRASGLEKITDVQELATKLYDDAEALLHKKIEVLGHLQFLRVFRNLFLQEIDRQWIDHLQNMEHLREGIGLRGYGQRDPKKEYKKEGFDLFVQMMESVKLTVASAIYRLETMAEEDVARLEAQRKRQVDARQELIRMSHDAAQGGGSGADGGQLSRHARRLAKKQGAAPQQLTQLSPEQLQQLRGETVKRDKPKLGRNDPCHCGSGKKYKQCHLRTDQNEANAEVG
ncbi:MAG: preprotein translocase subunit SecA [Myxococcales bacterium]|nr:MAG: preprotein translocase subunit SecA [Myxococcales bacterium]